MHLATEVMERGGEGRRSLEWLDIKTRGSKKARSWHTLDGVGGGPTDSR